MDFLFDLPKKVLAFVKERATEELLYLLLYEDYVKKLNDDVEDLQDRREGVDIKVDEAKRNGKEIPPYVDKWLKNVDEMVSEHDKYKKLEDHSTTGCSNGMIPNPWSRYHLGRRANEMSQEVKELVSKSNFDVISYQLAPTSIDVVLSIIGYENFKSRNETTEAVMAALKDSSIRMIGIYGLGGVGKTTLVKKVARKARKEKMFNVVVMASVTRNPNPKNIQGQIADMLGLRLEEESEIGRAGRLRERLRKEKENILVILDDLWEGLDLDKLGIPFDDDSFSKRTGKDDDMMKKDKSCGDYRMCKILLTSRSKEVLSNQMNVKENSIFSVGVLKNDEAEVLFKNVAGVSDKSSDFDALAAKIANKCGGLPMAIVTVARALRNKNYSNWNDALKQLESREFTGVQESMEFSTKLSYDHLESEELKSTFLLCARMGHHPSIMELLKFCIGLGILQGVHTMKEARSKIDILIQKLKDSSLLLDGDSSDSFNMHDTVRDAAMSIASKRQHVFTMRNCKLDEWPEKDELERYTIISLNYCDITDGLLEGITCPLLKLFHLESSDPFLSIPDNFFEGMRTLRVLILTGMDLSHLPTSIKYLSNLRMLCLEQCVLGDNLSIIGELKNLRILSLSGSKFRKLPDELRELGKLQLFDISNCSKVILVQPNVISRLNRLEELYMRNSAIQYEVEDQASQIGNDFLAELRNLTQLTTLDICIPNVAVLPQNLLLDKLDSYKITIGDFKALPVGDFKMPDKYESSRTLALQLKEGNDIHYLKGIKLLFRKVEILLMGELNGVKNVFYELNLGGFRDLKQLFILNNIDIEHIIHSMELSPHDAFPNLESLYLYKLESLKQICCSDVTDASFCKLKSIKIMVCPQLKKIFSFDMVRLLTNLEKVEVSECDSLHEIVFEERRGNTDNEVQFPQLHSLVLRSLPKFIAFYTSEMHSLDQGPSIEVGEITIDHGHAVTRSLFSKEVMLPNLESLELSSINICNIWSIGQPLPSLYFQNLMKLTVNDCNNLKHLLSLSMAASLVNLKGLFISKCEMMEEIFIHEEISMNDGKVITIFPKLEEIQLTCMEKLRTIWHAHVSSDSFRKLSHVYIEGCKELVTVFPYHMMGRFQSLEGVQIVNCESLEEIFDLKDASKADDGIGKETKLRHVYLESLPKLKHVWSKDPQGILIFRNLENIWVKSCPLLKNLLPASVAKVLEKLELLVVMDCDEMEDIVMLGEGSEAPKIAFSFAQVTFLAFLELPKLKTFDPGRYTIEWPALKKLIVHQCGKMEASAAQTLKPEEQQTFLPMQVISNLDYMGIGMNEAKILRKCIGSYRMHSLEEFRLFAVPSIEMLFWFLRRIPNLEILSLNDCPFEELFQDGTTEERIGTVIQLKGLVLHAFPRLQNIGFEHDPVIQRVEQLTLSKCPRLVNLTPSSVSFTHLTDLEICQCDGLINLVASSTAKSMVHLTMMKVVQCKEMVEIVAEESVEEKDEVVFSKLTTLELVSLASFVSFCSSKILTFTFPLLEKLIVTDCPKMKVFCGGAPTTPNLRQVHIKGEEEEEWFWECDLNATIQKISAKMVYFKYFQDLNLFDYPELEQVWHDKISLPDNCFHNLTTLVVENCNHLSFAIPSILLAELKNLEELRVESCTLVEAIFDIDDSKARNMERIVFGLKTLTLHKLPNLKHVWNKNPQGILCFENLQKVKVTKCERLQTMFPESLAKSLLKLETLSIGACGRLMEIITKEETAKEETTNEFRFLRLTSLSLNLLPELKCFYPGIFNLECPLLKRLRLFHCGDLKIFALESPYHEAAHTEGHGHVDISFNGQNSLFAVQKVIPNLEKMSINEKEMLKHGEFHDNLLHKLKCIVLQCFHNFTQDNLLSILKVPNIEELKVTCSGFKEVFSPQGPEVDDIGIFAQLKQLKLNTLCNLSTIGLEHSWLDPLHRNLETLVVTLCPRLTKLVHSAVSFSKLKKLNVIRCHGLVYLFTSSMAKSLVQLESMVIVECESIKEILAKEGEEEPNLDEIIFVQLEMLVLISLSSLVSFYEGKSPFRFPTLFYVHIDQCPKMKTFSQGAINSPRLQFVLVSFETDFCWEGDLNTTVHKLFKEKVFLEHSQHLNLSKFPDLKQIWLGEVPMRWNWFWNLKTLVVENCEFLSIVIPFNLMPYLKNLEELKVGNCSSVKTIFDVSCMEMTKSMGKVFRLKRLTLERLPNLRHVWNKNSNGSLSVRSLQRVSVAECESLKTLFPAACVAKDLLKLESLEIQKCRALLEIVGKDEMDAEGKIYEFVFCCLTSLTLNMLPELKCFYSGKFNLECPMLRVLNVYHCGKLDILSLESQSYQEALSEDQVGVSINTQPLFSVQKAIPNLEELSLSEKEIMMLWHGEYPKYLLHKLKILQLHCFHKVTDDDVLPYGFLHKVPNIESLVVACSDFKEIFPSHEVENIKILAQLKRLKLEVLSELNSIGLEHSWIDPLRENLKVLEVHGCPRLTKVVKSSECLSYLEELLINECHGLLHLFTSSSAKSLVQLRKMSIEKCESLQEIVAKEGDGLPQHNITFERLRELSLNSLSSLVSFYTGSSTLNLPSLEEVMIMQCPKMAIFSKGHLNAPMLSKIQSSLDENGLYWEGDLNSTVQKLCQEKVKQEENDDNQC